MGNIRLIAAAVVVSCAIGGVRAESEVYETSKFLDNWYVGVDAGVGTMFSKPNNKGCFGKRLGPAGDIYLGKWITPNVGVRGLFGYGLINGFGNVGDRWTYGAVEADDVMKKRYNLFTIEADVMYNVSNVFWGYKPDRVYSLIPFMGFGGEIAHKGSNTGKGVTAFAGISNQFRLSESFSLALDLKGAITSSVVERDKLYGGRSVSSPLALTVGAIYRFKPRGFKVVEEPDYKPYENEIEQLRGELSGSKQAIAEIEKKLYIAEAAVVKTPEVKRVIEPVSQAIFFRINSTRLTRYEIQGLELVANAIKKGGERKVIITGYADVQTGKLKFNKAIALKRANAVANVLVNNYGVNKDALEVRAGDLENPPFGGAIYNRAVIIE